jgi:hypothetical protein
LPPLADRIVGALALLLVALACLGRVWCSAFIAGRKDTELVTEGPYALVRHPLYGLSLAGALGLGLATRSIALTAVTAALMLIVLIRAARAEEAALARTHGPAYEGYARNTPGWWPRSWALAAPDSITVRPRLFWKAFLDAGSFVLLYVSIDLARAMREAGTLPTWIVLP